MDDEFNRLVTKYQGLIIKIIKRYNVNKYDFDDLYQAGLTGLYKAYLRYNENYHVKLSTYAFKYILGEVNTTYQGLKSLKSIKLSKIKSFINLNPMLTKEEVMNHFKINETTYLDAKYLMQIELGYDFEYFSCNEIHLNFLNEDDKVLYNLYYQRHLCQNKISKIVGYSQSKVSRKLKELKLKLYNY